jgi:hypothetical protein
LQEWLAIPERWLGLVVSAEEIKVSSAITRPFAA